MGSQFYHVFLFYFFLHRTYNYPMNHYICAPQMGPAKIKFRIQVWNLCVRHQNRSDKINTFNFLEFYSMEWKWCARLSSKNIDWIRSLPYMSHRGMKNEQQKKKKEKNSLIKSVWAKNGKFRIIFFFFFSSSLFNTITYVRTKSSINRVILQRTENISYFRCFFFLHT